MNRMSLREQYAQFLYVFYSLVDALHFARKNRLWEGFMVYGWASRLAMLLGMLAGFRFFQILWKYVMAVDSINPFAAAGLLGSFATEVVREEYDFLFSGGMKYGSMVLLEIFIFHITYRTLSVLLVKSGVPTLKDFLRAQVRIFKLSLVCWLLESAFLVVAKSTLELSILPGWFLPVITFLIQCLFLGLPILDNFTEHFGFGIREGLRYARQYTGVAIGLGLLLRVGFWIPLLGNLISPVLVSIVSVLVMYELSDLTRSKESGMTLAEELVD